MLPVPDSFWQCQNCGEEFYTCSGDLQILLKCLNCGSLNVKGGPIKKGGPMDEDSGKDY